MQKAGAGPGKQGRSSRVTHHSGNIIQAVAQICKKRALPSLCKGVAAYQACHFLGMPECTVHLTHAAVYLSAAPKSNALYKAYETAKKDALEMLDEPVPLVIRNAPTRLMKELHYGEGYQYAHDAQDKLTDMQCLPDSLQGRHYYVPTEQGSEARVAERLAQIEAWRAAHRKPREKE